MHAKKLLILMFLISCSMPAGAQRHVTDSIGAVKALKTLFSLYTDTSSSSPVKGDDDLYRLAAQYIIYRGEDKRRKWKDFCDYKNIADREQITAICGCIRGLIYQNVTYRVMSYETHQESEGRWHVLTVNFTKGIQEIQFIFAFLKIGNRYGLGDIDRVN